MAGVKRALGAGRANDQQDPADGGQGLPQPQARGVPLNDLPPGPPCPATAPAHMIRRCPAAGLRHSARQLESRRRGRPRPTSGPPSRIWSSRRRASRSARMRGASVRPMEPLTLASSVRVTASTRRRAAERSRSAHTSEPGARSPAGPMAAGAPSPLLPALPRIVHAPHPHAGHRPAPGVLPAHRRGPGAVPCAAGRPCRLPAAAGQRLYRQRPGPRSRAHPGSRSAAAPQARPKTNTTSQSPSRDEASQGLTAQSCPCRDSLQAHLRNRQSLTVIPRTRRDMSLDSGMVAATDSA